MRGAFPKQKTVVSALMLNLCKATGLPGGGLRWLLPFRLPKLPLEYHRPSPVDRYRSSCVGSVARVDTLKARNVNIHGASPWH